MLAQEDHSVVEGTARSVRRLQRKHNCSILERYILRHNCLGEEICACAYDTEYCMPCAWNFRQSVRMLNSYLVFHGRKLLLSWHQVQAS